MSMDKNNIYMSGAEAAASRAVEQARRELSEENRKKKAKLIKLAAMCVFLGVAVVFMTISWFTMSREVMSGSLAGSTEGRKFDLITLSSGTDAAKKGVYYNPYHDAIRQEDKEGFDVWLLDSGSNMNNFNSTGVADATLGIEPGSSGTIKFCIKPYEDTTVRFTFQTIGYKAQTVTEGGNDRMQMTPLNSAAGHPACFLNGHILLFEDQDGTTHYYEGLIPADGTGKRVFSREFVRAASPEDYDVDTDSDGNKDAYEVEIHWVWPITLDTLIYNQNSAATLLCNKDAAAPEGEINDYRKVVNNICTYPKYYLNGYSQTATYTEQMLSGRNAMYNDADQEIGMNVDYVLLRLEAESVSDSPSG